MSRILLLILGVASTLVLGLPTAGEPARSLTDHTGPVDFQRDVRPILSDRCYQCHGPDAAHRRAGLRLDTRDGAVATLPSGRRAIVPGDPGASALLTRIRHPDVLERMPPRAAKKTLLDTEIATLHRWVEEGAPYASHWAFVAPRRPAVPSVADAAWVRNPIDAFIRSHQERKGARPSPEADPQTLLRRLAYDLNGAPPSPGEIDRVLGKDPSGPPSGYLDEFTDRMFASPRYGEHMARHWLDAARYGDTHGLHLDNRRSMWPYRDWVIDAFNHNVRFDQFTIEQLAGDLLPSPTLAQRVATGFNRCNVTTAEGGLIAAEYLAKYAMDRVDTTSTVWLGMTVACAKCHDHKFDPVSQEEYYRLFAFFNSISEKASDGNKLIAPPFVRVPTEALVKREAEIAESLQGLKAKLAAPLPEVDAAQREWAEQTTKRLQGGWVVLRPRSVTSAKGATMKVGEDRIVTVSGVSPDHDVYTFETGTHLRDIRLIRLEALVNGDQPGAGVGRASHSNIVLTDFELAAAPADQADAPEPLPVVTACADYAQRDYTIASALDDKPATGWAVDGGKEDRTAVFQLEAPISFVGGTRLRIRMKFESSHPQHTISRFRLSVSDRPDKAPSTRGPWFEAGPFTGGNVEQVFKRAFGPEKDPDIAKTYRKGKVAWVESPQYVDGRIHTLKGGNRAHYFQRRITSPGARPYTFFVGSDDAIKVWINGEEAFVLNARRAVAVDQNRVTVQLRQGENRLLMKIVNGGGGFGFYFRPVGENVDGVSTSIARILTTPPTGRTAPDLATLQAHYRRNFSPEWKQLDAERTKLTTELAGIRKNYPQTMVMEELPKRRPAHVLIRGQYDQPGAAVTPGTPAVFPPLPSSDAPSRLELARWLVDPGHPLTARVFVNRLWMMVFGRGLVATPEDFGSQGRYPTHRELLDWLACEFVACGWDIQHMLRLMVSSATYRQSSGATPEAIARDPENVLYARGPQHRLDAEQIRDAALLMSGLLIEKVGGPSVKPYQPPGVWFAVGYTSSNTARFKRDTGDALWRRSMYTFWKRTAPPPTMQIFDAPSREACSVSRPRTNTPLQALALMNDVQYVEAARAFAERALREGGGSWDDRLQYLWRWAMTRRPDAFERSVLRDDLARHRAHYTDHPDDAKALLGVGESKADPALDPIDHAALTAVANMILNLHEATNKR